MLALPPPMFSTNFGSQYFAIEDNSRIGNEHQNYFYRDLEAHSISSLSLNFPGPQPSDQRHLRAEIGSSDMSCGLNVKKLNHNASERNRRKKVNQLYSSLRGLLPASDHMKKLSIPATVSRVLKYIPELRQQVDGLVQKRDELLSRINSTKQGKINNVQVKQESHKNNNNNSNVIKSRFPTASSVSKLSDKEVCVQISTHRVDSVRLSETLRNLEEDGVFVQNASSFESFGGRVFHNLYLQAKGSYKCGTLTLEANINLGKTFKNNDDFLL